MAIKRVIDRVLPAKLTSAQRATLKGKKLDLAGKKMDIKAVKVRNRSKRSFISEAGKTIRSVVATQAGTRAYEIKTGADSVQQARKEADEKMNNALAIYNQIMSGNPGDTGQSGQSGKDSVTEVGGSGSNISGY